jgi:hypothetical protein
LTLERQFRKNLIQFTRQDIFLQIRKIPYCDTICSYDLNSTFPISLHDSLERGRGEEEVRKVKSHESSSCSAYCVFFSKFHYYQPYLPVTAITNPTNAMSKPMDMNGMDLVITPPSSSL